MIKKFITSIVVVALLTVFGCNAKESSGDAKKNETVAAVTGKPIHLTDETFRKQVFDYPNNKEWKYAGNQPAIVDFYANWCGPCRMVAPILEELAKEYEGKIVIYKVDTDKEQALSQALGIRSLPTLVFIPVNGQPQAILGAQPKADLVKAINEILLTNKK